MNLQRNQPDMRLKVTVLTLVISAVIVVSESEQKCDKLPEYTRVKRAKYYSNYPQRFYRRPPNIYPVKGVFSYTPPPFSMTENEDSFPQGSRPPKVSKKPVPTPTNDGLGDEDINNIVKYLSKQDLDKIIEFASGKEKYNKEVPFEYSTPPSNDRNKNYKVINTELQYKDVPFEYSNKANDNFQIYKSVQDNIGPVSIRPGPYSPNNNHKPYEIEYDNPQQENIVSRIVNYPTLKNIDSVKPYEIEYNNRPQENIGPRIVNNPTLNSIDSANFDVQETMQNSQIAFFNGQEYTNGRPVYNNVRELYTDSKVMKEESLPRPVNLREDDYYGSDTNNVPSIVKAESSSYKLENFGDLPLMNYHSKLESVSSYHVPHYTVTTPKKNPKPSNSAPSSPHIAPSPPSDVPFEPAPPVSEAKAQSDAHLKATKIWTHRSKGTAYYLHSDGTLSLEKPQRPKPYGP